MSVVSVGVVTAYIDDCGRAQLPCGAGRRVPRTAAQNLVAPPVNSVETNVKKYYLYYLLNDVSIYTNLTTSWLLLISGS